MTLSANVIEPLVTVVIPNYNSGMFLPEAVESVQRQSYQNWELLIVDDGSTDNSVATIRQYASRDKRIRYILLSPNSGTPAVPRNRGLDEARGEYIAFLDADDLWHSEKLKLQVRFLSRNDRDFCFTSVLPFKETWELKSVASDRLPSRAPRHQTLSHAQLLRKNWIRSGSSVVLRASVVRELRFPGDPKFRAVEDYMLWLAIHQHCIVRSYWLKEEVTFYRLQPKGISRAKLFMAMQNYRVYSTYRLYDRGLGPRKYLYMCTYLFYSIVGVMGQSLRRYRRWKSLDALHGGT